MTAIALRRSQLGVNVAEINVGNPKVIEVAVRWLTQLLLLGDCDSQSETALPGSITSIRTSVLQLLQGVDMLECWGALNFRPSRLNANTKSELLNPNVSMMLKATAGLRSRMCHPSISRDVILNLRDAPDATSAEERCQIFFRDLGQLPLPYRVIARSTRASSTCFADLFRISEKDATSARC